MLPGGGIGHGDGVDVSVEHDGRTGTFAVDDAGDAAVGIHENVVKALFPEKAGKFGHHAVLASGDAGAADERLTESDDFFLLFPSGHGFLL